MKYNQMPGTNLEVSNLVMGNMRINQLSSSETEKLIRTAQDEALTSLTMPTSMETVIVNHTLQRPFL